MDRRFRRASEFSRLLDNRRMAEVRRQRLIDTLRMPSTGPGQSKTPDSGTCAHLIDPPPSVLPDPMGIDSQTRSDDAATAELLESSLLEHSTDGEAYLSIEDFMREEDVSVRLWN